MGSTGYTGATLACILAKHPNAEISFLGSQQYAGEKFSDVYPEYIGLLDLNCVDANDQYLDSLNSKQIDLVFFATPNGICYKHASSLIKKGISVIDLSADYRFRDLNTYEQWYGFKRDDHQTNAQAIYGLVEFKREELKKLKSPALIANPGCYTSSAILALAPLLEHNPKIIKANSIIIDGKSAISGAGRKASTELLFTEVNESCSPYKLANSHRHGPELEAFLSELTGNPVQLSFSPHLVPMSRGLLTTSYVELTEDIGEAKLREIYEKRYANEQFVTVLEDGVYPQTRWAVGTNQAFLQVKYDPRFKRATIVCAIDNLMKGAASQAVQNMNLLFGLAEETGL
jgi:N-acetyl-gamma-glutamyl-phosphate reductase